MRLFLCTFVGLLVATTAQAADFPYRAAIDGTEVYVRSGPGMSYYPTSRLDAEAEVTVHRHDPGGWYMIAPPPGSFSWIRAEYIRRSGTNVGELTANNVVVRVGSEFGEERTVEQRRLSIGDTVEIVGEETLPGDGANVRMYKIKPPQGEWRWIKGQYAVRVDDTRPGGRQLLTQGSGPRPTPPPDESGSTRDFRPRPDATPTANAGGNATVQTLPGADRLDEDRERLTAIDEAFRDMVEREITTWDLDSLEKEYRHLQETAAHPALRNQIDLRLEAVERYRERRREYDEIARLKSETERIDRELLSMRPGIDTERDTPAALLPAAPRTERREVHSAPRFDGAGIVQRLTGGATGRPPHVLLAPDGRLLAYLVAEPGANLDLYVGREVGLMGDRGYRAELGADLLRVRSLAPVRLKR